MCGILGITTKKEYKPKDIQKMAEILLKLSESRGKEATGLAIKRKESIDVLKLPISSSDFLKSQSYKDFSKNAFGGALSVIGHSRLATHGNEGLNYNNQPVVKDNAVCVHNGIIVNDEKLWQQFPQFKRNYRVDTEVFLSLLQWFLAQTSSMAQALKKTLETIEGSASIAVLFNNNYSLLLATNTGSLYVLDNNTKDTFVFASERYILEQFIDKTRRIDFFRPEEINQLVPGAALLVDIPTLTKSVPENSSVSPHPEVRLTDHSQYVYLPEANASSAKISPETKKAMQENWQNLYSLYDQGKVKRCKKCLLPETMTFIEFDEEGVCNYCKNYKKREVKGEEELEKIVSQYRRNDGKPNCLAPFSGGRDSSYGLHYMKKILKMNPVAYTYDWGMMTDLGRRNMARMCGGLGVEHIIISADIRQKRNNIRKNIEAWLKRPEMGMVPLFMAGDKEFEFHTEQLRKRIRVPVAIASGTLGLENDFFKIGCAGVQYGEECYEMPFAKKLKAAKYYFSQYLRNPSYINGSLFDTIFGAYVAFLYRRPTLHLYNYIEWDEEKILSTIINQYGWEKEKDTLATWRIDDGTAPFYNYIYLTVMGLTENDVLRSKLIREGQMEGDRAYQLIKEENKPRYDSLEWYARTIGFDINKAIKIINEIPKLYSVRNKNNGA